MTDGLRHRVRKGVAWSSAGVTINTVSTFGFSIVLARLLDPDDFGKAAMVGYFLGIAMALSSASFVTSLVYHRDTDADDLSGVFWTTLGTATALSATLYLAAPLIARFYSEPSLVGLTRLWAVLPILKALVTVPEALMHRELRLSTLSQFSLVIGFVYCIVATVAAAMGMGVWALAYAQISQVGLDLLLKVRAAAWRPGLALGGSQYRSIVRYAVLHQSGDMVGIIGNGWDNLIIGRFTGAAPLGYYRRARSLPEQIEGLIMQVARQVIFPTYATVQKDLDRVRGMVLYAFGLTASLLSPLLIGIGAVAVPLIDVLYGAKWAVTAPLLEITSWGLLFSSLAMPVVTLFQSQGRPGLRLRLVMFVAFVRIVTFSVAAWLGDIVWIAWAYTLTNLLLLGVRCRVAGGIVGIRLGDLVKPLARPFACAICMYLAVRGVLEVLQGQPSIVQLSAAVPVGGAVFLACAVALRLELIGELRSLRKPADHRDDPRDAP